MPKGAPSKRGSRKANTPKCRHCGQEKNAKGLAQHEKACEKTRATGGETTYDALLARRVRIEEDITLTATEFVEGSSRNAGGPPGNIYLSFDNADNDPDPYNDDNAGTPEGLFVGAGASDNGAAGPPQVDDIKIEYHPKSGVPTRILPLHEYIAGKQTPRPSPDPEPWKPFRTRVDFELAELMLDARMNEKQSAALLSLIHQCIKEPASFTITNTKDLKKTWDHARTTKATGFEKREFKVPYKGEMQDFEVYIRPPWSWICELLQDVNTVHHFRFHARRCYRFNGTKWVRFVDEPFTCDDWWEIQSLLPDGAFPIFLVMYADKTKLSGFGTQKGYPVLARIANLPTDIRNSQGVGGGILVGWLPIIDEDAGETGKKGYVNFKRVVWHKAFYEILESIRLYGKSGFHMQCADDILRWLFPLLLILSADYEEQCIMALIRGIGSHAPCPVCLVPADKLTNLSTDYQLRTKAHMQRIYESAKELNATEAEGLLKAHGLRDIENVFWDLEHCDPYRALSWDRLHAYHGGLFSDHIWSEFKRVVDGLGKKTAKQIDEQVDDVPRWSGLNHFSAVMKKDFTDGSKYEDIAKVIMFTVHNVLTQDVSPDGFVLLKVLRSYLELDMYTSLSVHTEETIAAGEEELRNFERLLTEYMLVHPDKNWNFPKAHTHKHVFADILRKGATRVYNTKPNEKAHSPLKDFYELMSNFKNIAPQILRLNENDVVATIIREGLEHLDELIQDSEDDDQEDQETAIVGTEHVSLGSREPSLIIGLVHRQFMEKPFEHAFKDFRKKLSRSLSMIYGKTIRLHDGDEITPYRLLRVNYQSTVDWHVKRDLLRVNPNFHHRERYDYVLVSAGNEEYFFAKLLYVFGVYVANDTRHMALILPMDEHIPRTDRVRSDNTFRFTRVRARHISDSAFIDVESIVRGAILLQANDSNNHDEFISFDVLDEDFWWRRKSLELVSKRVRLE